MCNIVFSVAVEATEIDRRLCLVELGIGGNNSIVILVQSSSCGHLLELLAGWDALQHGCIVNLTGVDNKALCDPETEVIERLLETRGLCKSEFPRRIPHPLSEHDRID